MNDELSHLSLTELYDKLSELTSNYSKSMLNGLSEKEFTELRSRIESLQGEITKRKKAATGADDKPHTRFPPPIDSNC